MNISKTAITALTLLSAVSLMAAADGGCPVANNVFGHENTEWQRAYAYNLTDAKRNLPRVLLIGDSIVNGYAGGVRQRLDRRMNISFWISSFCVTGPNYLKYLALHLEEGKYDVIHFNNGLHSLGTDTAKWASALEEALLLIRRKQPQARLIWATSTPINEARSRDPAVRTAKVAELNAAGAKVVAKLGGIETDDLFALMKNLDRNKYWSDAFHFRKEGVTMLADRVAAMCLPF